MLKLPRKGMISYEKIAPTVNIKLSDLQKHLFIGLCTVVKNML